MYTISYISTGVGYSVQGKKAYGERGRITLISEECLRALFRFREKLANVLSLPLQGRVLTNPSHNFGALRK